MPTTENYTTLQQIRNEIEQKVSEKIIDKVLEKGINTHCKRNFRYGCMCSYCQLKRRATKEIGSAVRWNGRQDHLRMTYRRKLKELKK